MRARPEQTQLEYLSDASFLGKLVVLPANVRLDWKGFAGHKHSILFGLIDSNEEKKFYNIDTWLWSYQKIGLLQLTKALGHRICVILSTQANVEISKLHLNQLNKAFCAIDNRKQ